MNAATARVFAILVTGTALIMAGMAGWYRGSSILDRSLLISIAIVISAASHLILSISKSRLGWVLWSCCVIGALYSHLVFFSYTSLRAGDERAEHSVQASKVEQQIESAENALALIAARPLTKVAAELAVTKGWRKRSALQTELSEARRAAALQDEIVRLHGTARVMEVTSATDPVTAGLARVTGITERSIDFFSALCFSVLLEFLGAFLWYQRFRGPQEKHQLDGKPETENEAINSLRNAIAAGKIKPTVKTIRIFLRCSQAKAMQVRREIVTDSY